MKRYLAIGIMAVALSLVGCGTDTAKDLTQAVADGLETTAEASVTEDAAGDDISGNETEEQTTADGAESTEAQETSGNTTGDRQENRNASESSEGAESAANEDRDGEIKANAAVTAADTVVGKNGTTYTISTSDAVTMYATTTVNLRSEPSKSGEKLGSVKAGTAVSVTGSCDETGWVRIEMDDVTGYANSRYFSETEPAKQNTTSGSGTQNTGTQKATQNQTTTQDGSSAQSGAAASGTTSAGTTSRQTVADGYNRSMAEAVWAYMNAERTAAGLAEIAWDESVYDFACGRAQQIVTNFSHDGHGSYGENILYTSNVDAYQVHMQWHNSSQHYENYMSEKYATGACAIYVQDGIAYAVENFAATTASIVATPGAETWTASNGVVVVVNADGSISAGDYIHTQEELQAALQEYLATH